MVEIDTDDYFKKDKTGKVQKKEEPKVEEKKTEAKSTDDDLLFDLC